MQGTGAKGYLRHVDGLRGISILLVVLYHAWPDTMPGGYIGVDVFFVISGFLITRLLLAEHAAGTLRYRSFLMRRVRRLWPSFALVFAFTLLLGWVLLDADELADLGRTALATIGLSSNWYFALTTDYFNETLNQNLLLHSWSLAVEEQFYLIYPLLLLGAARFRRGLITALGLIWVISLAATLFSPASPGAFFVTHLRVWELASGALLWCGLSLRPADAVPHPREHWLGSIGLVLILAAGLLLPSDIWWPSAWTLLPVIGALFCIGYPSQWLQARWLVGLGLISYALYLWHWPLLRGLSILYPRAPDGIVAIIVLASIGIAWLAWRYVEEPVRRGRVFKAPKALLAVAGSFSVLLAVIGWQYHANDGFPARLPADLAKISATEPDPRNQLISCQHGLTPLANLFQRAEPENAGNIDDSQVTLCAPKGQSLDAAKILYVGDSHLGALIREISGRAINTQSQGVVFVSLAACAPVKGVDWRGQGEERAGLCESLQEMVSDALISGQFEHAVFVAHWDNYVGKSQKEHATFGQHFDALVAAMSQATKLHVLLDVPTHDFDVPVALVRQKKWSWLRTPQWITRSRHELERAPYLDPMQATQRTGRVVLHDPLNAFCPEDTCLAEAGGEALFFDSSHVSQAGAAFLLDSVPELPY